MIEWMRDSREDDDADITVIHWLYVYAPTNHTEKTTYGPVTGPCVPGKPPA